MSIMVRRAKIDDLENLRALAINSFLATFDNQNPEHLIQSYVDTSFSSEAIAGELADADNIFFVTTKDVQLTGYLKLQKTPPLDCIKEKNSIEIERLYADPDRKGEGIGKALLDAAKQYALEAGFSHIWLGVWEHNTNAIAFYEHLGFKQVGEKTFMMADDPQTDFVMIKAL